MKKHISLLLIAALSLGFLVGCRQEEGLPLSAEKEREIRQAYAEYLNIAVDEFPLQPVWHEDGIYALYVGLPGGADAVRKVVLGEPGKQFEFIFPDSQRLYIYKDKVFYTLKKAYSSGIITTKHLESLHKDDVYKNRIPHTYPTEDTLPTESYPLPPYSISLSLSSMEEYKALVKAAELTESNLQAFLDRNGYEASGIKGKEDIIQIRDFFSELPFPHLEGARLTTLLVSGEALQVYARYELSAIQSVTYRLSIGENSVEKGFREHIGAEFTAAEEMKAPNYTKLYYTGFEVDAFAYCASINGCFLKIRVITSTREAADKIVRETIYKGI